MQCEKARSERYLRQNIDLTNTVNSWSSSGSKQTVAQFSCSHSCLLIDSHLQVSLLFARASYRKIITLTLPWAKFVIDFKTAKRFDSIHHPSKRNSSKLHCDRDKWLKNVLSCLWSSAHINGLLVTIMVTRKPWNQRTLVFEPRAHCSNRNQTFKLNQIQEFRKIPKTRFD